MSLTIKDLIATIIAAGVGYTTYANINGISVPMFQNPRVGVFILLVVGIFSCAMTGTPVNEANKSMFITIASILGASAFVIFLWGVISGNRLAITLMGIDILALWAITTLRHLLKL